MLTYSIVIRTLGTAGDKFREELVSITKQTVQPDEVRVYIAEGYDRPNFTIGRETYYWTKKGMMAQRLLPYDDIESDCIMMLDDDVCLARDSAERMLSAMEQYDADCVGADIFKNQDMSMFMKFYAAATNLVFPHYSKKWAFKINRNGSFSYNNNPTKSFYWSQSCGGPASVWRKSVYKNLHMSDESWMDDMGFAYGDDALEFYKIYRNGYKLGVLYDSGIKNLSAGSASSAFHKSPNYFYTRTKAMFCIWWRSCFMPSDDKVITAFAFMFKIVWMFFVMCATTIILCNVHVVPNYLRGLRDGWRYVHSDEFKSLPSYLISR
jgi:GT2 family glycosyltransferase